MDKIVILGDKPKLFKLTSGIKAYDKVSAIPLNSRAIIVSQPKDKDWFEPIKSIRAQTAFQLLPVFYLGDIDKQWQLTLYDGPADETMGSVIDLINDHLKRLYFNPMDNLFPESLLLSYLYSRPNKHIQGLLEHRTPQIFFYPLVEALLSGANIDDIWQFLEDLVLRDLLVTSQVTDEIQICKFCHSGFLNAKYCCPSCSSINIKKQKLVHCYLCGNIAPVPEFLREERLICQHCKHTLKERSIDYDRPKQDKLCQQCGHYFEKAEMKLTCLVCHRSANADELITRYLHDYMITTRGQQIVCGLDKNLYRTFEQQFRVVDYQSFMSTVSWFTKLCQREESLNFALIQIKLLNDSETLKSDGYISYDKAMGKLFSHLRDVIRKSDLSARDDDNFYFLLPMTDEAGLETTINRIKQFIINTEVSEHDRSLSFTLSSFTSQEILNHPLDADMLIAEIQAKMAQHAVNLSISS